jgi:MOSC domain-containing protein YiiM
VAKILSLNVGLPRIVSFRGQAVTTGIYFRVLKEGQVKAGDTIELVKKDKNNVTVMDIVQSASGVDIETIQRAIQIEALAEGWRQKFLEQLAQRG